MKNPPPLDIPLSTQPKQANPQPESPSREDVPRIQRRLHDLGFLPPSPTGVWDGSSRDALRDFKVVNRLGNDAVWTGQVGEALVSPGSIRASQSFIGRWCGEKKEPPLIITSRRATSSSGGVCEFSNFDSGKGEWRVRAACTQYQRSWTANIRFVVQANKMIWSSESGTASYVRCN
jgi:hypothetical protein